MVVTEQVLTILKQFKGKQRGKCMFTVVTVQYAIRYSPLPSPASSEAFCGPNAFLKNTISVEVWKLTTVAN